MNRKKLFLNFFWNFPLTCSKGLYLQIYISNSSAEHLLEPTCREGAHLICLTFKLAFGTLLFLCKKGCLDKRLEEPFSRDSSTPLDGELVVQTTR